MATTPEGKVKKWLGKQFKTAYPDHWFYAAPGGRFGRKGMPDGLYCINGLFVAIEVKTLVGKLTPMQKHELIRLSKAGAVAAVIYGEDQERFDAIRRAIDKKTDYLQRQASTDKG